MFHSKTPISLPSSSCSRVLKDSRTNQIVEQYAWEDGLIALACRAIEVGNTEAAVVALIEAEYGVETEEEAKDIVTLARNRF